MDIPMPPQQIPPQPVLPIPRIRGPAIIRKFFRKKREIIYQLFYFRINRSKFTLCITLFYPNTSTTI
jgi:hypothetical protein